MVEGLFAFGGLQTVVDIKQVFGTENYYIQGEGCGHEVIIVPLDLQILVRHWHGQPAGCNAYCKILPSSSFLTIVYR